MLTNRSLARLLVLVAGLSLHANSFAQTSVFTYQGSLMNAGAPANGPFDFAFKLFDAVTNGTQIAGTVTNADLLVSNGLFTASLDFGASSFTNASRWLEISVRTNLAPGGFTTLSPRQLITAAPMALFALSGNPGPAGASGAAGTAGQSANTVVGTNTLTVSSTTVTPIPGLTQTLLVPSNSVVYVSTDGGVATTSTVASTGLSEVEVFVMIDGTFPSGGGWADVIAANTAGITQNGARWSLSFARALSPGTHTIEVRCYLLGGSAATVSGNSLSIDQGELTILLLKQ